MIFIILFVIAIIFIQICLTLTIKIEIKNLRFCFPKVKNRLTNKDNKIFLKVYIFNKIRVLKIDLKKLNSKNISDKVKQKALSDGFNRNTFNFFKNSNYILEKMDLKIEIGDEDAFFTAIEFGIINALVGNILKNKITDVNLQKFQVTPAYNRNIFKVNFDGIFTFKMANIIGIIKYLKKRSVDKNVRASDRRTYAYNNE